MRTVISKCEIQFGIVAAPKSHHERHEKVFDVNLAFFVLCHTKVQANSLFGQNRAPKVATPRCLCCSWGPLFERHMLDRGAGKLAHLFSIAPIHSPPKKIRGLREGQRCCYQLPDPVKLRSACRVTVSRRISEACACRKGMLSRQGPSAGAILIKVKYRPVRRRAVYYY
jgi:hypothetical protein